MELDLNLQKELVTAISQALNGKKNWIDSPWMIAVITGITAILSSVITATANHLALKRQNRNTKDLNKQQHKSAIAINEQQNQNAKELRKLELEHALEEKRMNMKHEALHELCKIFHEINPTIWDMEDYDSYEAYNDVVLNMNGLRTGLDEYLKNQMHIIPHGTVNKLSSMIHHCNETLSRQGFGPDATPNDEDRNIAQGILNDLDQIIFELKQELKIQDK